VTLGEIVSEIAACVDIGGTKALLGLVTRQGEVLARQKIPIAPGGEPVELVQELAQRMRDLAARSEIEWGKLGGLGYSTAGMMDSDAGIIFASPNQGSWRDVPFTELLQQAFGLAARIEMDANAGALGEAWLGAGRGADPLVYLVIGTGIGAGILANGRMIHGWRGTAGEFGHTIIDPDGPPCNCGGYGCLESLASGPAIARRAVQAWDENRPGWIADHSLGRDVTAEMVFNAARRGDAVAKTIITGTVEYLSIGLTNLIHLLNPRTIVLGGGVGLGGADLLLIPLRQAVAQRVGSWVDIDGTTIALSQLGADAGLLGAAWLVWHYLDKE
jgi:glucokinase